MPNNTYHKDNKNKSSFILSLFIFIFLIAAFLGSDIYYSKVGRPFDYFSIFLLLILCLFFSHLINKSRFIILSVTALLISFPWILFGSINDNILAASAFLLGISFIFPTIASIKDLNFSSMLEKNLKLIIFISILIFTIQVVLYYFSGFYLDLTGSLGSFKSRGLNTNLDYFRPSGLFQEPNAYCAAMFSLLYLCKFFNNRNYLLEILGLISIIISQSLWGFAAALLLILLLYSFEMLIKLLIVGFIILILFYLFFQDDFLNVLNSSITIKRILYIENDPSRIARYGSIDNLQFNEFLFFGHGIDTKNFQSIAANGYGFLIYSFGFIGMIILAFFFIYLINFNINVLISISFLITTYPLFSYIFFWVWIGIILFFLRINKYYT